ncbi:hypothetical protein [Plesiomonas shigelloides]|nr:hypothetical protein [Plesiomonas shigelloides]
MASTDTALRRNDSASRHSAIASIVYKSLTKVGNTPTLFHSLT